MERHWIATGSPTGELLSICVAIRFSAATTVE
ncbi:MAG: hypothetical protein RLZZ458_937 [Planctomycetota bacterium]